MKSECLKIEGGNRLNGETKVYSAKNAVLPMLAAAMLTEDKVAIKDCPKITDIDNMLKIRECLSLETVWQDRTIIASGKMKDGHIPESLAGVMRSSVFMLGPMLAQKGKVKLHTPGGCKIGARPIDIHLSGLEKLGAKVKLYDDGVECIAKRLRGAEIVLRYPSVGATENLITAAVKAKGDSTLIGVAREPEVVSLCEMLVGMGAKISGLGTSVLKITGVDELYGTTITPVTDRIVAGTVILAVALTGGKVRIDGCNINHLGALATKLVSKNMVIVDDMGGVTVESDGKLCPTDVASGPYPKFPTDLQPILAAVLCQVDGVSTVEERVFESRFSYVGQLKEMGANISVVKDKAVIVGGRLYGAEVGAKDLRGGAGIVVAALNAKGTTFVRGVEYIDRGYEKIEYLFASLGGKISRI